MPLKTAPFGLSEGSKPSFRGVDAALSLVMLVEVRQPLTNNMTATQTLTPASIRTATIPTSAELAGTGSTRTEEIDIRPPTMEDGQHLWELARDSQVLDLNSSYSYLLWCRDFAETSAIATLDDTPAGFVTGYTRPESPETLMIWQIAVGEDFRGRGLATHMLEELVDWTGAERLETTITMDNSASTQLFSAFAERRGAECERTPLFTSDLYPDDHDTEFLYEIEPLRM